MNDEGTCAKTGRRMTTALRRVVAVGAAATCVLAVGAADAAAHVTVSAPGASQGGSDQLITFRVPNESDAASTIGFQLQLPTSAPIASVLVQPIAGWSFTEKTTKLATPIKTDDGDIADAISEIDWKADSKTSGIAPQQFQQFTLIAGLLPKVPSLIFRAIQQYSDGSTVSWTEVAAAGSTDEPEHAAPVLTLAASSEADSAKASATPTAQSMTTTTTSKSNNTVPIVIAAVAVLLAVVAIGLSLRRRSS